MRWASGCGWGGADVKAITWRGVNEVAVEHVPEPTLLNDQDALVRVIYSSVCGSDLHLLDGYVPTMAPGDVIGHEFLGEIVEVGAGVTGLRPGQRVVVCSIIGCGRCWYCQRDEWSLCDNTNVHAAVAEAAWGSSGAGIFGYSQAFGGFPGSHTEYVRVPYADHNAFPVPEEIANEKAVFASDAVPTGWMAADMAGIAPGDIVAVWGAGGVGLMAARAAYLLGAEQVIVIDRVPERLGQAERHVGARPLDYTSTDVPNALLDLTGGRSPDRCIEAVGMESHGTGLHYAYDRAKQAARLETGRAVALRQAIYCCRKGGTVSVVGVFGAVIDKFPMGAVVNKALTVRSGQQHGQRYIPMLLERMARGEIDPSHLMTHPMPLDDGPRGYALFKEKRQGCLRAVFHP